MKGAQCKIGGLAQLGERLAGSQKVIDSSPLSSTCLLWQAKLFGVFGYKLYPNALFLCAELYAYTESRKGLFAWLGIIAASQTFRARKGQAKS